MRRPHPFFEELGELFQYRDLLRQWSFRNLTLRYKRSVLGVFWTLLEPLLMMAILSVVFTEVFRFAIPNYPLYVLSGLLSFDFFSRATIQMMDENFASQHLTKRIYAPRSAFALASVVSNLVNWFISLLPLMAIMWVLGAPFSWSLLTILPGIALMVLFASGVGLAVATVAAFFHDIRVVYQVALTAWFYATPVLYPLEILPEPWQGIFQLNPLLYLVETVRRPVFLGAAAPPSSWLVASLVSFGVALTGWWVFTRWKDAFSYA